MSINKPFPFIRDWFYFYHHGTSTNIKFDTFSGDPSSWNTSGAFTEFWGPWPLMSLFVQVFVRGGQFFLVHWSFRGSSWQSFLFRSWISYLSFAVIIHQEQQPLMEERVDLVMHPSWQGRGHLTTGTERGVGSWDLTASMANWIQSELEVGLYTLKAATPPPTTHPWYNSCCKATSYNIPK